MTDRHNKTTCSIKASSATASEDLLSGVRSRVLAGALGLGMLVGSCGSPTDSGGGDGGGGPPPPPPPPANTPMVVDVVVPLSYSISDPQEHRFRVEERDSLREGVVSYVENDSTLWSRVFSASEAVTRWDTTWTPQPVASGEAFVRYELIDQHPENPETVRGEEGIELLASRWREQTIVVENFFDQTPLEQGYLTFSGGRTVEVTQGTAQITPADKIDADSLQAGQLRALLEANNYLTQSQHVTNNQLRAIPREQIEADIDNWTWEKHKTFLRERNNGALPRNQLQERWDTNAEITVYLYDQSVFRPINCEEDCFEKTTDENLLATDFMIQNSKEIYQELQTLLTQAGTNIQLTIEQESLSEKEFPQTRTTRDAIYVAGEENAPFTLTQSDRRDPDGTIYWAEMTQQTKKEREPAFVTRSSIASDAIEGLGPNTTRGDQGPLVNQGEYQQPFVSRMLEVIYQHPPRTGTHTFSGEECLDNKDQEQTCTIDFYVPQQE